MTPEKLTRREFNKTAAAVIAAPALLSLPKPAVSDWRKALEAQIRETLASPTLGPDTKWEKQALVFAPEPFLQGCQYSYGDIVAQKTFEVDLGYISDYRFILDLTQRVNRDQFCGAPPETLLLSDFWMEKRYTCDVLATVMGLTFTLRTRSFNEFWNPQAGEWQRLSDAAGSPVYPPADFNQIP